MSEALTKSQHTSIRNTGRAVDAAAKRLETQALTRGRPGRKLTPEVKMQLVKLIASGRGLTKTCAALGFSHSAAIQEAKRDKAFGLLLDEARVQAKEGLEESMYERAKRSDTTAGIFLLKAMDPERYGDRLRIDEHRHLAIEVSLIPADQPSRAMGEGSDAPILDAEYEAEGT